MNILITFLAIAIFQGVVLGTIILKSPLFKSKANKYLAYAIYSLSSLLLVVTFDTLELYESIPVLQLLESLSLELAFPVFIYLFIAHQVKHPIISKKRRFWLFAPFLYTATLNVLSNQIILGDSLPYFLELTIGILLVVGIVVDIVFIPAILIHARSLIKTSVIEEERKWLTYLWLLVFVIFATFTVTIFLALFLRFDIMPTMRILGLFVAVLIHWVVYTGLYKFKLANDQKEIRELISRRKEPVVAPIQSALSTSKLNDPKEGSFTENNAYFQKLQNLCANEQVYRDCTLDREKIAALLNISPSYVSLLVNSITGDNFSTYINRFRVEEVKKHLLDPAFDHYSLLAIGLECGFSSKTTFHTSFKKITGMTPSAYKEAQG